ncbi:PD-(D/E)XK nuclease family protein [bacterium]|nr:PD-(D/E)XK nuclease family protein [bacterium]
MTVEELKLRYDKLLKDVDFDKLDLGIKNPNIFQILRISKSEIRHSNFLAWLLSPNESHKLGDIFLKRFLREVFSSDKFGEIDQVDVEGMNLSKVDIFREWNNIDILIKLENVVVCIENKVLSKEHSNQLKRYREIIARQFPKHQKTFVLLTPEGITAEEEGDIYEPISYEFIIESLDRIIHIYGESLNQQVINYIKDYITIIKRELMGTDKLTELAKKIYENHRELLDFIIEHKPDIVDGLRLIMIEELKKRGWILGSENKNYVRWFTPKIKDFIYYNKETKNGWNKRESFLFEIVLRSSTNKLHFKTVLSPTDLNYDSERVEEILKEISGSKASKGKKWLVNIDKKDKFIYDEIPSMNDSELRLAVNKFFDKIIPIIESVEKKFIEHQNELLKLKNI